MLRLLTVTFFVAIAGCAWQSEALRVGPETWQTSANASPARGAASGAREMALGNANKHCDSLNRQIEVVDSKTEYAFPANAVVTITFKCIAR